MNAVDTGWINDENPVQRAERIAKEQNFQTPIDEVPLPPCLSRSFAKRHAPVISWCPGAGPLSPVALLLTT